MEQSKANQSSLWVGERGQEQQRHRYLPRCTIRDAPTPIAPNNPTTQRKQKPNSLPTTATGSSTIQQPNNKQTYKDLTNTQQPNSLHSKETTTNQQPRKLLELTENSTSTLSISRIKKEWSGLLKLRPPR